MFSKTMDVTDFPTSVFHGESVKFFFDSEAHQYVDKYEFSEGSLGVFHFAFASEEEPAEDKEAEYSVESLFYFPKNFFSTGSPLQQMATCEKYSAGLMDKLQAFSTTGNGDLFAEVVVGVGKRSDFLPTDLNRLASTVASVVSTNKLKTTVLLFDLFSDQYVELFLTHLLVHLCPDNRFKKDTKNEPFLENVVVVHPTGNALSFLEKKVKVLGESVNMARELVSAPPNYANTVALSRFLKKRLSNLGFKVEVLDPDDCKKLGMFCFLSVGQGSKFPQKFVHAVYEPEGQAKKTLVFVGKGITFDSGGYNTKNASSQIHLMKMDMGGFSTLFGAANALGKLKPKNVKVHFVSALCENMVDKNSYRPGDVYQASNGKTVEVLNTDAEGRVTLADSLSYASKLDPDYLVDFATLTGAQIVALGNKCAAYYSNDEELAELYKNAANMGGELVWRMPLLKEYKEFLKSKLADLANVSFNSKAGSVTAALFLKEFVGKAKWVHVDMAGPVWDYKAERGTGYGVLSAVYFTLLFA